MIENLIAIGWIFGLVASIVSAGIYNESRSKLTMRIFIVSFAIFAASFAANCSQQRQRAQQSSQEGKQSAAPSQSKQAEKKEASRLIGEYEIVRVEFFEKPAPVNVGGKFSFRPDEKFSYTFVRDGKEIRQHKGEFRDDVKSFRLIYDGFTFYSERWEYRLDGDLLSAEIGGTLIGQDVEEHFVLAKRSQEIDFGNPRLIMRRLQ